MWDKLGSVFDMENPLMRALAVVADLILLNFLTIIGMIPVVTAGASLTARNDVLQHIVRKEEGYIARSFWASYKRNLRQGSIMGLIFAVPTLLLIFEYDVIRAIPELHLHIFYAMLLLAGGIVLACGIYAFHLLARFENTIPGTIKNALMLSLGYLPRTVGMIAAYAGFWAVVIAFYMYLFPVIILFATTLPAYVCTLLMGPALK